MQTRVWAATVAAAFGFGSAGVATRAALNAGLPPYALSMFRALGTGVVALALLLALGRSLPRDRSLWRLGAIFSIFQIALPYVLFTLAYGSASAGFVGLLAALFPLATALIAHFVLADEPLSSAKVAGLMVALAGVSVMLLSGDSGLEEGGRPLVAFGLGIVAVLSISSAGIIAKRDSGSYGIVEITGIQSLVAAIWLFGAMIVAEGTPPSFTAWTATLMAYLIVAGSVVPFLLFYWLLRHVSSTRASLIGYLVPLVALVLGIALIDERLQPGIAVGGLLILAGVLWTDLVERRNFPPAPSIR